MKKIWSFLILYVFTFAIISGCGKTDESKSEEAELESLIQLESEENTFEAIIYEDGQESVEKTPYFEDYVFEPMDEIINASIYEGKIQVGDVIIRQTELVYELFADLENSEVEWNYDYTPEQLVLPKEGIKVEVSCGYGNVFNFKATNYTKETIALKDCVVRNLEINPSIYSNIYYGQGYCINGENVPNYLEYVDICKKAKEKPLEEQQDNGDISTVWNYECIDAKIPTQKIALYDGIMAFSLESTAIFDSKTGKCVKYMVENDGHALILREYDPDTEGNEMREISLWDIGVSTIKEEFVGTYVGEHGTTLELLDNGDAQLSDQYSKSTERWSYENGVLLLSDNHYAETSDTSEFVLTIEYKYSAGDPEFYTVTEKMTRVQ